MVRLNNYKSTLKVVTKNLTIGIGLLVSLGVVAEPADDAKTLHERLVGAIPSGAKLDEMVSQINAGNAYAAAMAAIESEEDHGFYNVTLKNMAAPWTNRDFDVFAPLNDYIATVVGLVRFDEDFRTVLYDDVVYVGSDSSLPAFAPSNNAHYSALEAGLDPDGDPGYSLRDDLVRRAQSSMVPALANGGASGVVTSRAGAKAFLIAGTNRAAFRFTLLNHLCLDLEQVHDVTLPPDRIRQDVSRSPGGDSSIFLNNCLGCHSGMDPLTQALAYHDYDYDPDADPTGDNGQIMYTDGEVRDKYFRNADTFPYGYATPNDNWANYWRQGKNTALGWDPNLPGEGEGASSMFEELAHSNAFAQCHVQRVYENVCLRGPQTAADTQRIETLVGEFMADGNLKHVFASAAAYCVVERGE